MPDEVVVTGYGVLTCFGFGDDGLTSGVFAGVAGFGPVTRFDTGAFHGDRAASWDGAPAPRRALGRCARDALAMAGDPDPDGIGLLLGTQGDHTATNRFSRSRADGTPAPEDLAMSSAPELVEAVAADVGATGRRAAFVNACVASTTAIVEGCRMIAAGWTDRILCGGAYLVDEQYFALFDSGRSFAKDGTVRPFDAGRSGLLLGDGAGVLLLESADAARQRGVPALARVRGWGMSGDAHHGVRPHPEGAGLVRAVRRTLDRAGAAPRDVDYVNAHGTGTPFNDRAETAGLHTLFGATPPPVSSTKSTTGHMLEGTGAVEAVLAVRALRTGTLPPTAGYRDPDPDCALDCVPNDARVTYPRTVLSLNAAFGGANAALLLEAA